MKCKMTPIKVVAALAFAFVAFGFASSFKDTAPIRYETPNYCLDRREDFLTFTLDAAPLNLSETNRPNSEFMARLFQLMFILFFISPPIIALMLFLIWKELKKRSELK